MYFADKQLLIVAYAQTISPALYQRLLTGSNGLNEDLAKNFWELTKHLKKYCSVSD